MNGKRVTKFFLAAALLTCVGMAVPGGAVESLRGDKAIGEASDVPVDKPVQSGQGVLQREFAGQPPLIPHSIEAYPITQDHNACTSCHGKENIGEGGPTAISASHFINRDGEGLEKVSAARHFCTQCHVPQRMAEPLVGNAFKAGNG